MLPAASLNGTTSPPAPNFARTFSRSEERRGGEEGRFRGWADHLKKKKRRVGNWGRYGRSPYHKREKRSLCRRSRILPDYRSRAFVCSRVRSVYGIMDGLWCD